MASPEHPPSSWDDLPNEIFLQVLTYLRPHHITQLQQVSRRLQKLCRDNELWKRHCFDESPWYQVLQNRRRARLAGLSFDDAAATSDTFEAGDNLFVPEPDETEERILRYRRTQDMANWDPTFPGERVSWYDEYVQRNGPASVNWFEPPKHYEGGEHNLVEARGLALYAPNDGAGTNGDMMAVSPLDDGSVCLWDVRGTRGQQGAILAKSALDILFIDGPGGDNARRSKKVDTGVTDCVSVSNFGHKAFFAVQSHLIEVDLNRLEVVDRESFEWSITALSQVNEGCPITVGTSLGIHLHDFRERARVRREAAERLDNRPYRVIFDDEPLPPYASLSQPTPVSILHLPQPGSISTVTDDIYVSGRFTSILHYDRRKFPSIIDSIHSGAMINTLAALPYPFSTVESEVRRYGEFSVERAQELREAVQGQTVIAGGAYNTKGSLEIYGLGYSQDGHDTSGGRLVKNSVQQNRQTAASSSILSLTSHGTKIVFSDGSGLIKWFERDGITECRRMRIGNSDTQDASGRSIFASMPASDDLARKIVSTRVAAGPVADDVDERPNNDNIVFWTGEKLGMVSFTTSPLWTADAFASEGTTEEDVARAEYTTQIREALERQADEVKFVSRLGYGP
ncbi:f-box-like domain-containing protein [Sarocladium implicatum]|nr:f-box-like domain-containing protein [Sarocladium implicatum]